MIQKNIIFGIMEISRLFGFNYLIIFLTFELDFLGDLFWQLVQNLSHFHMVLEGGIIRVLFIYFSPKFDGCCFGSQFSIEAIFWHCPINPLDKAIINFGFIFGKGTLVLHQPINLKRVLVDSYRWFFQNLWICVIFWLGLCFLHFKSFLVDSLGGFLYSLIASYIIEYLY